MRSLLMLAILPPLAGCAIGGGRTGPGKIPADAYGAMYTARPADRVAACLAAAIGGSSQAQGPRLLVSAPRSPAATYDVGPITDGGAYATEIVLRGSQDAADQRRAATCLVADAPPS